MLKTVLLIFVSVRVQAERLAVLPLSDAVKQLQGVSVPIAPTAWAPFEALVCPLVLARIAVNTTLQASVHGGEDFHGIASLFDFRGLLEMELDIFHPTLATDSRNDKYMGPIALYQFIDQGRGGHLIAKKRNHRIAAVSRVMVGENA